MIDWQPIETAPKDGQRLLLWAPPYGPSTGHFIVAPSGEHGAWRFHSLLNQKVVPTHWAEITPP